MIKPAELDLEIFQGATFRKRLRWTTGNPPIAVPLTDWVIRMQIRPKVKSEEMIIELTTENGRIIISNPEDGEFELLITPEDTAALSFNSAVYDLELENLDGEVVRLLKGMVSLDPEVTR